LFATDANWSDKLNDDILESREFVAMLTTSVRKLRTPPDT
jgi:hypothetical protein